MHKKRNDGLPSMYMLHGTYHTPYTAQHARQGEQQPVYSSEVTFRASCFSEISAIYRMKKVLTFLSLEKAHNSMLPNKTTMKKDI